MTNCNGHHIYRSLAAAEQDMAALIAHAKRTGEGGKSYKRLCVFPCSNHFHVGRSNKLPKNYAKPAPQPKPESNLPTFAEARRMLRRMDRDFDRMTDHFNRWKAEYWGKIIAAERARGEID